MADIDKNASLGDSLAESTQTQLGLQVEAPHTRGGRLWALTTGSRRRTVREQPSRTLAMVLPILYLWLRLPAVENQRRRCPQAEGKERAPQVNCSGFPV